MPFIEAIASEVVKLAPKVAREAVHITGEITKAIENGVENLMDNLEENQIDANQKNMIDKETLSAQAKVEKSRFPGQEKMKAEVTKEDLFTTFESFLPLDNNWIDKSLESKGLIKNIERHPSEVYRNILDRFLSQKERFNSVNYFISSEAERIEILKDAYKIFAEELKLPMDKIQGTPITFGPLEGANAAYFYGFDNVDTVAKTVELKSEGIVVNDDLLRRGNFLEAINSVYHETLHQFQLDVLENPAKYPFEFEREQWFDSIVEGLEGKDTTTTMSYYSDSMEMFAHQHADYFEKTYKELNIESFITGA